MEFKRKLRCVQGDRSPGGTVIRSNKRRESTAEGLTPMIAQALRKKFEVQILCIVKFIFLDKICCVSQY